MKALVVDDSSTIRAFLRSILVPLGFEVAMAKNGLEGLEGLDNPPRPDLALIDWHMPEMDGLQLLTEIRSRPELDQMTVVLVTAENDLSQISLALDSGANEYVMKPLTREIVTEKLQMLGF
jgi:two-component system chemotaxis response regulator CheY